MKTLILAFASLVSFNASAAIDVNQLFKDVCTGVSQQSETSNITFDYCMQNGRFSTEGSYASGFWWGGVTFMDPKGDATYSCAFDIRTDHKFRTYACERHVSQGE